jgi:hypothetical protein
VDKINFLTNLIKRSGLRALRTIFEDGLTNLNIFVEIFNNGQNQSDCVIPILEENGANVKNKYIINFNFLFQDCKKNFKVDFIYNIQRWEKKGDPKSFR